MILGTIVRFAVPTLKKKCWWEWYCGFELADRNIFIGKRCSKVGFLDKTTGFSSKKNLVSNHIGF